MSVGGEVVEVIRTKDGDWVNTLDQGEQTCAVYVWPDGETIREGDCLWWQGEYALWTPRGPHADGREDVRLRRNGGSGVGRPIHQGKAPKWAPRPEPQS